MNVTINRLILNILLLLLTLHGRIYAAGFLDLSAGIGVDYKSYSRDADNISKQSQQLDKIYLQGEFARDLYFKRLGDIYLKFDLSKYKLSDYQGETKAINIPFFSKDNASKSDFFLHDITTKINLNIPKVDLKLLMEYSEETKFSVNDNEFFTKVGKTTDDIEELRGLHRSLNDRDWQRNQNYFLSRDGDVSFMANYSRYDYDKTFETVNYMTLEDVLKFGIDLKRIAGIYFEDNTKKFKNKSSDETLKKYKIGTIDYFGNDRVYKFNKFRIKTYYQSNINEYKSRKSDNKYGVFDLIYDINDNRNIGIEYEYKDVYDKYTVDYEKYERVKGKYEYQSKDLSYYLFLSAAKQNNIYPSSENVIFTFDEINNLLSTEIKGKGKITIRTINSNLLSLNLTLDDVVFSQNILVSSSNDYVIEFNRNIKGSITIVSGDKNDLSFLLYREYGGIKDQKYSKAEVGYYFKKWEFFKSKLDLSYQYVDVLAYETSVTYNDQKEIMLYKLFEIRPFNLIFDKSFKFANYKEGLDSYTDMVFNSSDGYFSKTLKFYLKSEYWKRNSKGVYDELEFWKESLILSYLTDIFELSLIPSYGVEDTKDVTHKNIFRFDSMVKYSSNRLTFQYQKEDNLNFNDKKKEMYLSKNLVYRYEYPNFSLNFEYLYNKSTFIYEIYSPSITYTIYKIFPRNDPYLIADIGAKFEKNQNFNLSNKDRYFFVKLTYKPTVRLESIFVYEKAILDNKLWENKGDDYEFILSYKSKVFKLSLGYRNNKVIYNNERRDEDVVYFKIDKSFNYSARVK